MSNEQKLLAKRAKRDGKRKTLKQHNAAKKVATTKAKRLVADRREAVIKLRDDIFDFIVQKDSFKKFLTSTIVGGKELKETGDSKYDGIIISAYEKGLAKIDELIEPRLTKLAKIVDNIDPNKEITTTIGEFLEASSLYGELSVAFNEILEVVNRYHNHNVSIYNNADDPEKIVTFSEDDFNFDSMGNTKTDSESDNIDVLNVFDEDDNDTDDETSDNEDVPNSHEDAEVDVVVSDESEDKQVDDTESIK
jgi:hypothetical protein